jgi:hypothetical protein
MRGRTRPGRRGSTASPTVANYKNLFEYAINENSGDCSGPFDTLDSGGSQSACVRGPYPQSERLAMESGEPVMEPGLLKLIRSHVEVPDAEISRVFAHSPAFRSLSRDFRACVRALDRWKNSDSEDVDQRVEEYSSLRDALVLEMHQMLREGAHAISSHPHN